MKRRSIMIAATALAISTLFSTAAFAQGWEKTDGKWFYWQEDGTVAKSQWITDEEIEGAPSYYVKDNGEMATSQWVYSDESWYYVDASGIMLTNQLLKLDSSLYWVGEDGKMVAEDWVQDEDGKWYYMQADGSAVKGKWYTIGEDEYYFLPSGAMAADALAPGGYRVDASGKKIK